MTVADYLHALAAILLAELRRLFGAEVEVIEVSRVIRDGGFISEYSWRGHRSVNRRIGRWVLARVQGEKNEKPRFGWTVTHTWRRSEGPLTPLDRLIYPLLNPFALASSGH